MRVFIAVLVLIFSLQSWTKADDIRDFQIEGMSIGDSLLDFYTEEVIKIQTNAFKQYPKSQFFVKGQFYKNLKIYDVLIIHYKKNDKKYKIYSVGGALDYGNKDIKECYAKMDEINNDISKMFSSIKVIKKFKTKHRGDPTGKSTFTSYYYNFKSGDGIKIQCYDWSKETGFVNNLRFSIAHNEQREFLRNDAY
jgi:hypothetical protein